MKPLLIILIVAMASLANIPAIAVATRNTAVMAQADTLTPQAGFRQAKPIEKTAILSFGAAIGAFASLLVFSPIPFLLLLLLSIITGIVGLVRIRKSKGRLGGRLLAGPGLVLGISFLAIILLASLQLMVLP